MEKADTRPPTFEETCQYILSIVCAWGDSADEKNPVDFSYIGSRCGYRYPEWFRALKHLIRTGWVMVRPDGNIVAAR